MRASDKSVFRFLLDKADWATAELPPRFTPPRKVIARKTSISFRQVTYAIDHLRRHGWLITEGLTGPGKTLNYTLSIGASCDCTGRVHDHRTVATEAPPLPLSPTVNGGNGRQSTVATFGYRSVATNGGNAAGQTTRQTRGTEREAIKEADCRPINGETVKDTVKENIALAEVGCPRHQTIWGPQRQCLYCQALNIHLWP
jgi:hypothetical protein